MTMRAAVTILALALLTVGCGDDEAASGGGGGGGGTQLAAPLTFTVSGGDAFRRDKMLIRPDGSFELTTGGVGKAGGAAKSASLTPSELSDLAEKVDAANLEDIPARSLSEPPIPDALGYRIVYKGRQIDADDGSNPDELKPLTARLTTLVDRYKG